MIEILATGPLCSVQDAGRRGYRKLGVSVSGVMDALAYRIGNLLVGNEAGLASIEITVFPFKIKLLDNVRFAVTGAACQIKLDDKSIPPWWVSNGVKGQTLSLSAPTSGTRAYLAVKGGIDVPPLLGSRSTDIKVGFGGFEGRCLRRGDLLPLASHHGASHARKAFGVTPPDWSGSPSEKTLGVTLVRVVTGPEYEAFTTEGLNVFWNTEWQITSDSNRIGYRLDGPAIPLKVPLEMLSHGIVPGVIQIPPDGKPIVMMADAQTSGGYPKVGTVIQADLWRLAQAPLRSRVRFEPVSVEASVVAMKRQAQYVNAIAVSIWRE